MSIADIAPSARLLAGSTDALISALERLRRDVDRLDTTLRAHPSPNVATLARAIESMLGAQLPEPNQRVRDQLRDLVSLSRRLTFSVYNSAQDTSEPPEAAFRVRAALGPAREALDNAWHAAQVAFPDRTPKPAGRRDPDAARAELIAWLHELRLEADAIGEKIRPINDPDFTIHKQRIDLALETADDLVGANLPEPRHRVVPALEGLARACKNLRIPVTLDGKPDGDRAFALEELRGALGRMRVALDEARESASVVFPGFDPIPTRMADISSAAQKKRVAAVLTGLDAFQAAVREVAKEEHTSPTFTQQGDLVRVYVRSIKVEINLPRLHLTVNDTTLDLGALVDTIAAAREVTVRFRTNVIEWYDRLTDSLVRSAEGLDAPLKQLINGVKALGGMIDGQGDGEGLFTNEPEMVVIRPGTFRMGIPSAESKREGNPPWDKDARPEHDVTIRRAFLLGKYPVTRGEYARFAEETNRTWPEPHFEQTDRHPAVNITWEDATAYAAWLSELTGHRYRLPSEAEWEYACRAGTTTARWWGNKFDPTRANFDRGRTTEVDAYPPNPWGLHDMLGNALEWCEDRWHDSYKDAPDDGSAWLKDGEPFRVVRGGSWNGRHGDNRSGNRDGSLEAPRPWVGFRLARTL